MVGDVGLLLLDVEKKELKKVAGLHAFTFAAYLGTCFYHILSSLHKNNNCSTDLSAYVDGDSRHTSD